MTSKRWVIWAQLKKKIIRSILQFELNFNYVYYFFKTNKNKNICAPKGFVKPDKSHRYRIHVLKYPKTTHTTIIDNQLLVNLCDALYSDVNKTK